MFDRDQAMDQLEDLSDQIADVEGELDDLDGEEADQVDLLMLESRLSRLETERHRVLQQFPEVRFWPTRRRSNIPASGTLWIAVEVVASEASA